MSSFCCMYWRQCSVLKAGLRIRSKIDRIRIQSSRKKRILIQTSRTTCYCSDRWIQNQTWIQPSTSSNCLARYFIIKTFVKKIPNILNIYTLLYFLQINSLKEVWFEMDPNIQIRNPLVERWFELIKLLTPP